MTSYARYRDGPTFIPFLVSTLRTFAEAEFGEDGLSWFDPTDGPNHCVLNETAGKDPVYIYP